MAHEIDKLDCEDTSKALDRLFARVETGGFLDFDVVKEFIKAVELFQKKHIKQIPAILKKGSNGQQMY